MVDNFFVGVSGFSYASWRGKFYPKETKPEEFLAYYSGHLGSVEINSSFYALPKAAVVKGWSEKTSAKFRFAFKAPGRITHVLKLGEGSAELTETFSKTLDLLGPRRGPVLLQLPPYMKQDNKLLADFLSKTSGVKDRVFEFRHKSWLNPSTYALLEKHGTSFCIADTEEMKPEFKVTGGLAYFRLRKDSYNPKDMDGWAASIRELAKGTRETHVYLRHDETGENAVLAQRLSEKLQPSKK